MEGASAQELEVDERAIQTDELMGRKGLDAQKKAYEVLRGLMGKSAGRR
jgi:hypothetical protein